MSTSPDPGKPRSVAQVPVGPKGLPVTRTDPWEMDTEIRRYFNAGTCGYLRIPVNTGTNKLLLSTIIVKWVLYARYECETLSRCLVCRIEYNVGREQWSFTDTSHRR